MPIYKIICRYVYISADMPICQCKKMISDICRYLYRQDICRINRPIFISVTLYTTLEPVCMVHGYKVFWHKRSILGWFQSYKRARVYWPPGGCMNVNTLTGSIFVSWNRYQSDDISQEFCPTNFESVRFVFCPQKKSFPRANLS